MTLPDGNSSVVKNIQIKAHGDEVETGKGKMKMADGTHLWANHVIRKNQGTENILKDAQDNVRSMLRDRGYIYNPYLGNVKTNGNS